MKFVKIMLPSFLAATVLIVASILIVFRVVPYIWGTAVITIALLSLDKDSIKKVNYPLLTTFCVFFVFSGNMVRIPAISVFFKYLLSKNTLLFGILICYLL